jgi:Fe-S-cluster containining protein
MIQNKNYSYKFDETKCSSCDGNCCIGESGFIWINNMEINLLAKHLNITSQECHDKYLYKYGYKFSIKEKQLSSNNYACVFFDTNKKQCGIYDVRPTQCRTFPFWDHFKENMQEVIDECPAIVK